MSFTLDQADNLRARLAYFPERLWLEGGLFVRRDELLSLVWDLEKARMDAAYEKELRIACREENRGLRAASKPERGALARGYCEFCDEAATHVVDSDRRYHVCGPHVNKATTIKPRKYDCDHFFVPDQRRGGACAGDRGQGCDHPRHCHPPLISTFSTTQYDAGYDEGKRGADYSGKTSVGYSGWLAGMEERNKRRF